MTVYGIDGITQY